MKLADGIRLAVGVSLLALFVVLELAECGAGRPVLMRYTPLRKMCPPPR